MAKQIYCCGCRGDVSARLTNGAEIYPHRSDLAELPFWKCDACGNWVGCHHRTSNPTNPLGTIATPEIRNARKWIHQILDPIWKKGKRSRASCYAAISEHMGWNFHTSKIRTIEEAREAYRFINDELAS